MSALNYSDNNNIYSSDIYSDLSHGEGWKDTMFRQNYVNGLNEANQEKGDDSIDAIDFSPIMSTYNDGEVEEMPYKEEAPKDIDFEIKNYWGNLDQPTAGRWMAFFANNGITEQAVMQQYYNLYKAKQEQAALQRAIMEKSRPKSQEELRQEEYQRDVMEAERLGMGLYEYMMLKYNRKDSSAGENSFAKGGHMYDKGDPLKVENPDPFKKTYEEEKPFFYNALDDDSKDLYDNGYLIYGNEDYARAMTPEGSQALRSVVEMGDDGKLSVVPQMTLPEIKIDGGSRNDRWNAYHNARGRDVADAQLRMQHRAPGLALAMDGLAMLPVGLMVGAAATPWLSNAGSAIGSNISGLATAARTPLQALGAAGQMMMPSTYLSPVLGATVGGLADAATLAGITYEAGKALTSRDSWRTGGRYVPEQWYNPEGVINLGFDGMAAVPMIGIGAAGAKGLYNGTKWIGNSVKNVANIINYGKDTARIIKAGLHPHDISALPSSIDESATLDGLMRELDALNERRRKLEVTLRHIDDASDIKNVERRKRYNDELNDILNKQLELRVMLSEIFAKRFSTASGYGIGRGVLTTLPKGNLTHFKAPEEELVVSNKSNFPLGDGKSVPVITSEKKMVPSIEGDYTSAKIGHPTDVKSLNDVSVDLLHGIHVFTPSIKSGNLNVVSSSNNPEFATELRRYIRDLEQRIDHDGIVVGSTRVFSRDDAGIGGVPHDVEIITTKGRADKIKKQLEFQFERGTAQGTGVTGTSRFALGADQRIDINILPTVDGTHVTGVQAISYMRNLYPEEMRIYLQRMAESDVDVNKIKIPKIVDGKLSDKKFFTDEEFYKFLCDHQKLIDDVLYNDMFSSIKDKHVGRAKSVILTNGQEGFVKNLIQKLGETIFGKDYKSGIEIYKNIDLSDIKANKKLLNYFGLPESVATNKEMMENIINKIILEEEVATRVVSIYPGQKGVSILDYKKAIESLRTNIQYGNGSYSGPGGNYVIRGNGGLDYYSGAFLGALRSSLTFNPEKVKNAEDIVNLIEGRRIDIGQKPDVQKRINEVLRQNGCNEIDFNVVGTSGNQWTDKIVEAVGKDFSLAQKIINQIAHEFDSPGIRTNGYDDRYLGNLATDYQSEFSFMPYGASSFETGNLTPEKSLNNDMDAIRQARLRGLIPQDEMLWPELKEVLDNSSRGIIRTEHGHYIVDANRYEATSQALEYIKKKFGDKIIELQSIKSQDTPSKRFDNKMHDVNRDISYTRTAVARMQKTINDIQEAQKVMRKMKTPEELNRMTRKELEEFSDSLKNIYRECRHWLEVAEIAGKVAIRGAIAALPIGIAAYGYSSSKSKLEGEEAQKKGEGTQEDEDTLQKIKDKSFSEGQEYAFGGRLFQVYTPNMPNMHEGEFSKYAEGGHLFQGYGNSNLEIGVNPYLYKSSYDPILKHRKPKANFYKRLQDPNRQSIPAWESNGRDISTHKMAWTTEDGKAIVYPEVQEVDGKLIDFTRPPYDRWAGYNNAISTGDTIQMTPEQAKYWTENYKRFYPF